MHIYIYFFFCDYRSLSASITHGEFDLFVRPSAATYCYKCKYTYGVHDTVSKSSTQYSLCSFATMMTPTFQVIIKRFRALWFLICFPRNSLKR